MHILLEMCPKEVAAKVHHIKALINQPFRAPYMTVKQTFRFKKKTETHLPTYNYTMQYNTNL